MFLLSLGLHKVDDLKQMSLIARLQFPCALKPLRLTVLDASQVVENNDQFVAEPEPKIIRRFANTRDI